MINTGVTLIHEKSHAMQTGDTQNPSTENRSIKNLNMPPQCEDQPRRKDFTNNGFFGVRGVIIIQCSVIRCDRISQICRTWQAMCALRRPVLALGLARVALVIWHISQFGSHGKTVKTVALLFSNVFCLGNSAVALQANAHSIMEESCVQRVSQSDTKIKREATGWGLGERKHRASDYG